MDTNIKKLSKREQKILDYNNMTFKEWLYKPFTIKFSSGSWFLIICAVILFYIILAISGVDITPDRHGP